MQRATSRTDIFQFINTIIDADEPKSAIIREVAEELRRARKGKGKIAVVAGRAIVRTGAGQHLVRLIEAGYVDRLFAGNPFAGYDVERALFGTSLGISLDLAFARGGRENVMRAVNVIRQAGSLAAAVKQNVLNSGIMHACVRNDVDIVLTGSIRDEGSIPGATTDAIDGQKLLRKKLTDVTHALLLASIRHSLAVVSMLPPTANPSAVERVVEQQPLQSIGMITDVDPFLRELADCLSASKSSQ